MSEISGNREPKPQNSELTQSQMAMKDLCDEILALRPEQTNLTYNDIKSSADPEKIQERLRASLLGDLMLKDGDSLSASPTDEHHPDLDLYVGQAELIQAGVRAWGWEYDKHRIDPDGPTEPPYDIIDYPGEKDWIHQLDIKLWYFDADELACQTVTVYTSSITAGTSSVVSRKVLALTYVVTAEGYEGHNQVLRTAQSEEEVLAFVDLARELFNTQV